MCNVKYSNLGNEVIKGLPKTPCKLYSLALYNYQALKLYQNSC